MSTHFDNLLDHIPDLVELSILDIGSGRGDFLLDVTQRGGDIIGLDKNEEYIQESLSRAKRANLRLKIVRGEAEKIPFEDSRFDFVNLSEVIEHMEKPEQVIKEVYRILKSGGMAYLSVPSRFSIKDSHFHLYFLNWLPRLMGNFYITIFGKHKEYSDVAGRQRINEMHYYTFRKIKKILQKMVSK